MISEIITRVPKARVLIISDITRLMSLLIVQGGRKVMCQRFELISNERSLFAFFTPLICLDHYPLSATFVRPTEIRAQVMSDEHDLLLCSDTSDTNLKTLTTNVIVKLISIPYYQ